MKDNQFSFKYKDRMDITVEFGTEEDEPKRCERLKDLFAFDEKFTTTNRFNKYYNMFCEKLDETAVESLNLYVKRQNTYALPNTLDAFTSYIFMMFMSYMNLSQQRAFIRIHKHSSNRFLNDNDSDNRHYYMHIIYHYERYYADDSVNKFNQLCTDIVSKLYDEYLKEQAKYKQNTKLVKSKIRELEELYPDKMVREVKDYRVDVINEERHREYVKEEFIKDKKIQRIINWVESKQEFPDIPNMETLLTVCIQDYIVNKIAKMCVADESVNEQTYFRRLKENFEKDFYYDFMAVTDDIMYHLIYFSTKINPNTEFNEWKEKYNEEHEKLLKTEKRKDEEIEKLNNRIINLSQNKLSNTDKDKAVKDLEKSYMAELKKIKDELKKKEAENEILTDKVQNLNEYINDLEYDEENEYNGDEEKEETIDVDRNLRYVFVSEKGKEGYPINQTLLREFPNSKMLYGSCVIDAEATDLVVLITKYLKHGTYYGMVNQCKGKHIDYIHCNKSSLEGVLRTLATRKGYVEC